MYGLIFTWLQNRKERRDFELKLYGEFAHCLSAPDSSLLLLSGGGVRSSIRETDRNQMPRRRTPASPKESHGTEEALFDLDHRIYEERQARRRSEEELSVQKLRLLAARIDHNNKGVEERVSEALRLSGNYVDASQYLSAQIPSGSARTSLVCKLSAYDESRIHDLFASGSMDEMLVDEGSLQLTRQSIQCLLGLRWLTDEVLNAYLPLIERKGRVACMTTFFFTKLSEGGYNYGAVRRWTRRRKLDIFSLEQLLIPVHLGNHWTLGVVSFIDKTFYYLDALGGVHRPFAANMARYLRDEAQDKVGNANYITDDWKVMALRDIPLQENGSDCGVFMALYATCMAHGRRDFPFSQADMPTIRKHMALSICQRRLTIFSPTFFYQ